MCPYAHTWLTMYVGFLSFVTQPWKHYMSWVSEGVALVTFDLCVSGFAWVCWMVCSCLWYQSICRYICVHVSNM